MVNAGVGSQSTHESSLNRNLAMNEGTLSRKALGGLLTCLLAGMCSEVPRGSWSGWSVRLGGGRHMFLGCCHHGNGSSCGICCKEGGGATTWSHSSRPGITNKPGTWGHLAPGPWAEPRNEIRVFSTAVKAGQMAFLESVAHTASGRQG